MALSVDIVIDITAEAAGTPNVARTFPYTKLSGAPTVTLSLNDITEVTSFNWEFVDKPEGSSSTISSATAASPTFTPDVVGTYLVQCTVNSGAAYNRNGIAFTSENLTLRKPASGETTEFDTNNGWKVAVNDLFNKVDHGHLKLYEDGALSSDLDYTLGVGRLLVLTPTTIGIDVQISAVSTFLPGYYFYVVNASTDRQLSVKKPGGTTIGIVDPGNTGIFVYGGATHDWYEHHNSLVSLDVVGAMNVSKTMGGSPTETIIGRCVYDATKIYRTKFWMSVENTPVGSMASYIRLYDMGTRLTPAGATLMSELSWSSSGIRTAWESLYARSSPTPPNNEIYNEERVYEIRAYVTGNAGSVLWVGKVWLEPYRL